MISCSLKCSFTFLKRLSQLDGRKLTPESLNRKTALSSSALTAVKCYYN